MTAEGRDALIAAIAEASGWIDDHQFAKSLAIPLVHPRSICFTSA
jgi:hypothetical protein